MKSAALALMLCAWPLTSTLALDTPAPPILGRWLTEPRDGIIEITLAADGTYQGKIIGGNAPTRVDAKNPGRRPSPAVAARPAHPDGHARGGLGDGSSAWSGGTIYEPDTGRTYRCHIELIDRDHLKVRGFIGISLLGRSQTWTRFTGSVAGSVDAGALSDFSR